jgi:hypothetical protein
VKVKWLTPLGVCLTSDAPGSTRNYARWIGTPGQWGSWGNLLHSIKSGESALRFAYGVDAWTYRMRHPEEQAVFDSAMSGNSRSEAQAVLEAFDFSRFSCVVDVGGGQGLLLKTILLACPATRGILFDQPQVIASADQALASAELAQRCQIVAGTFFESAFRRMRVVVQVAAHAHEPRALRESEVAHSIRCLLD